MRKMNTMEIDGYRAVIRYDPDIEMFRGEFVGLNGGADFYARDIAGLKKEGALSLKVFLEMCREEGVEPGKSYSGKFNVRIPTHLHETIAQTAVTEGKSLNRWIAETLDRATNGQPMTR
uniref:Predicted nuclease of the RNAse H fold, HicB family n=1 Tax=Candidatus Kentrum sp. DK TaxID=2126562 RepID=A0A450SU36_9GAMM|nr:MAG: Predicted nuclease of the RNAse H fold, HicB family [Candidatus Kentron sp. DK]